MIYFKQDNRVEVGSTFVREPASLRRPLFRADAPDLVPPFPINQAFLVKY